MPKGRNERRHDATGERGAWRSGDAECDDRYRSRGLFRDDVDRSRVVHDERLRVVAPVGVAEWEYVRCGGGRAEGRLSEANERDVVAHLVVVANVADEDAAPARALADSDVFPVDGGGPGDGDDSLRRAVRAHHEDACTIPGVVVGIEHVRVNATRREPARLYEARRGERAGRGGSAGITTHGASGRVGGVGGVRRSVARVETRRRTARRSIVRHREGWRPPRPRRRRPLLGPALPRCHTRRRERTRAARRARKIVGRGKNAPCGGIDPPRSARNRNPSGPRA